MTVKLSDEAIFAAADAVLASGRAATPSRVRAYLGRGSPQRIGAVLDQWWARFAQEETRPAALSKALGMLWKQATLHARESVAHAVDAERETWVGERELMEKAFAKQYGTLEHKLTKEREAASVEVQRLRERNACLDERLQQSREDVKEAKVAVRAAQTSLHKAKRQLSFAQVEQRHMQLRLAYAANKRSHPDHVLSWQALHNKVRSRPMAEPWEISENLDDGVLWDLRRDFEPLLISAQRGLERRFDELRQQAGLEPSAEATKLSPTQWDLCIEQLQLVHDHLDELRHQASAFQCAIKELDHQYWPLRASLVLKLRFG